MATFKIELEKNSPHDCSIIAEKKIVAKDSSEAISHACLWLSDKDNTERDVYFATISKMNTGGKFQYYCTMYRLKNEYRIITKTAEFLVDPVSGRIILTIKSYKK